MEQLIGIFGHYDSLTLSIDESTRGIVHIRAQDLLAEELSHIQLPENVKLVVDQPPVFPPIQADSRQIRLLMHHLIDNAIQAVENGGVEWMADLLIQYARDSDGKRAFSPNHRSYFMEKVDSEEVLDVGGRFAAAMAPESGDEDPLA